MATTTRPRAGTAAHPRWRVSSGLLLGAALVIGMVVVYASGARYADGGAGVPAIATGEPRLAPTTLGSLDRAWVITGDEAARQIASLHVGAVRVDEAEVAGYGADTTVWVATTAGSSAARRMLAAMVQTIDRGTTPFAETAPVADLPGVYRTTAEGEAHLFFASGDAVWWLASPPEGALDLTRTLYAEAAR